ncbi:MAG: hypothetical protein ACRDQI_09095 [Pseudonocardiaceae bacterium]
MPAAVFRLSIIVLAVATPLITAFLPRRGRDHCGHCGADRFFFAGDGEKLVYTRDPAVSALREAFGKVATVVGAGTPIDLGVVLEDLAERIAETRQIGNVVLLRYLDSRAC